MALVTCLKIRVFQSKRFPRTIHHVALPNAPKWLASEYRLQHSRNNCFKSAVKKEAPEKDPPPPPPSRFMSCFGIGTMYLLAVKEISSHAHNTRTWYLLGFFKKKFPTSRPVLLIWVPPSPGNFDVLSKLTNLFSSCYLGDMNICRWGADVGSLGSFLYICGGSDDSSRLETVERFDPYANVWVPSVPMSSSRNGVGVAAGNGRIYALGRSCRKPFEFLLTGL